MINKVAILLVLQIFIISTLLSGCVAQPKEVISNWCNTSMNITFENGKGLYTVKGITTYKGREVCEVLIKDGQRDTIQYFNKGGGYMVVIYKDESGNIVKEINISNTTNN